MHADDAPTLLSSRCTTVRQNSGSWAASHHYAAWHAQIPPVVSVMIHHHSLTEIPMRGSHCVCPMVTPRSFWVRPVYPESTQTYLLADPAHHPRHLRDGQEGKHRDQQVRGQAVYVHCRGRPSAERPRLLIGVTAVLWLHAGR